MLGQSGVLIHGQCSGLISGKIGGEGLDSELGLDLIRLGVDHGSGS